MPPLVVLAISALGASGISTAGRTPAHCVPSNGVVMTRIGGGMRPIVNEIWGWHAFMRVATPCLHDTARKPANAGICAAMRVKPQDRCLTAPRRWIAAFGPDVPPSQ